MNIITKTIKQIIKLLPVLLILGFGIYFYLNNKSSKINYETTTEKVLVGNIQEFVSVSGTIKPERQVSLFAKATQTKVSELAVSLGQKVTKDQVLAKFTTNIWADREIVSPIDGIITNLNMFADEVPSYQRSLVTINSEKLYAELEVSEYDVAKIKPSQSVTLHFDGFDKNGKVSEVALNPSASTSLTKSITYTVKIELDDQGNLRNGFSFDADIVISSKDNILKVSSSALKSTASKYSVEIETEKEVSNNDGTKSSEKVFEIRPVEVGINNDTEAEIISGLKEGEEIVLEKKEVKTNNRFNLFNK
ncbi:HlyD family efflux transporter periplasmic adaptor subunit [bacterium]|nr:MAG: HlyD family efflux transporter periplasmic adaptor subunit [bacterium]